MRPQKESKPAKQPARKPSKPRSRDDRQNEDFYSGTGYGYNSKESGTSARKLAETAHAHAQKTSHERFEKSREENSGYGYGHDEEHRFSKHEDHGHR